MTISYRLGNFFLKHSGSQWKVAQRLIRKLFLRKNRNRIEFYRGQGAKIGKNVILGWDALGSEPFLVEIGDNVYISSDVRMFTHDGGVMQLYYMGVTEKKLDNLGKIKIGNNCFIGAESIILKNVTIGDNSIIGAGAVVTRSIPSGVVAVGIPARPIETIEEYYEKNKSNYDDTYEISLFDKYTYTLKHYC